MNPQQRKPKFSPHQIFSAILIIKCAIGVGAGYINPDLGTAVGVGMTIVDIVTYKDKNNKDE
ncbi:hypothetical protein [Microcoleus sp. FACHB-672]|uniref:hypothetical protein n=1 Tax=Microcoleus sp. FACHB-672 TaxID=2692825 RepID=UPI00168295C0|nr:hypothetical protein [Microcoleus sp. FACHB-672]MBD2042982.1 hypothetical protein [Microcoleus sp. FACHB-672]